MSALKTEFTGEKGDLFALALRTGLLTVVTLGIYRFWQKTRLRRWYWSSVRPGGMPFEYTGTPQEKLMGFLVAVIVLAGYLALVNIAGMFVAVRLSTSAPDIVMVAAACAPIALVPVVFVARYRARRDILSRTSWLGVRFGMDAGAWGYAWRACLYWLLTLLTLTREPLPMCQGTPQMAVGHHLRLSVMRTTGLTCSLNSMTNQPTNERG